VSGSVSNNGALSAPASAAPPNASGQLRPVATTTYSLSVGLGNAFSLAAFAVAKRLPPAISATVAGVLTLHLDTRLFSVSAT
jgi:hypothetical protein